MTTVVTNKQGSVVAVSYDMILVRYEGKGVLFKKNLLTRAYRHDEIVEFSAKKAATVDIEVGDKLSQMAGYPIGWLGTDIRLIKQGKWLKGEGVVITMPNADTSQFMFVDWKYTINAPKALNRTTNTNVFITRATVRPEVEKLTEMFKVGQRVRFVAREQAPNEKGVCWRSVIATDDQHEILDDEMGPHGRPNFRVCHKSAVPPRASSSTASSVSRSSSSSQRPAAPKPAPLPPAPRVEKQPSPSPPPSPIAAPVVVDSFQVQKPPPIDGFDYFDTSKEACAARFRHFAASYRVQNPACLFSQTSFEGFLKIKYLQQMAEEMAAIRAVEETC